MSSFPSLSQAGAGGAAPGGTRGEEETPQGPEGVRGPVLQAKRKVKTTFGRLRELLFTWKISRNSSIIPVSALVASFP